MRAKEKTRKRIKEGKERVKKALNWKNEKQITRLKKEVMKGMR